jgi:hypothetical protein
MTYLLYSWQDSKGSWSFSIFPGVISREFTRNEVYRRKGALRGLDGLKRKIAELPPGSTIALYDRVVDGGRFEHLGFPPADILNEIKRYAEPRKIKIAGP